MTVKGKRTRKLRPRNGGKFTEAQFWWWIRTILRKSSRQWAPIALCRKNARRKYIGSDKRIKYEYKCNKCGQYFDVKNIEVDHIFPAGSLNCAADLPGFVERLFCEVENLQCLCIDCHLEKSIIDTNGKFIKKKKKL